MATETAPPTTPTPEGVEAASRYVQPDVDVPAAVPVPVARKAGKAVAFEKVWLES